jgi:flagellar hook-length control protein FliK
MDMRATTDVTMVPKPAKPASTTDTSSAATSTATTLNASFKKKLEGAQTKQKGPQAKGTGKAVAAKPVQKLPDDENVPDEKEPVDTETAATEIAAENAAVEETAVPQTPVKDQPAAKTGKQKAAPGKVVVAAKQEKPAQLTLEKPAVTKTKVAKPAVNKQNTDSGDTTDLPQDTSNPAASQMVANSQTQTAPEPAEQDAQAQGQTDDVTTKAVVPAKAAKADAAAPAQSDDNAPATADFDDAVEATEEMLGKDDSSPMPAHDAGTDAVPAEMIATPGPAPATTATKVQSSTPTTPLAPEAQFADTNHPKIVSEIHGKLLPNGGTMTIRLDPPELGALQISVHVRDGVMTAAFETSNDQATRVLSHSLGQLKSALESAGMSVEKLHVQQSSKQESSDGNSDRQQSSQEKDQQQQARQEQQRRQMLNRMWRKLAGGEDPLDLVA